MTLNLTLVTRQHIIQASDRRMVSLPDGKPINDRANKGLVLKTDDGTFAITFAGIGLYAGARVDLWLAEKMQDEGVPELPIGEGVEMIARLATEWFSTFSPAVERRHTFVVAGWVRSGPKPRPAVWSIANCLGDDGSTMLASPKDEFEVRPHMIRGSRPVVHSFGLVAAVGRAERRRLEAALRKSADVDRAQEAVVEVIRAAATKPQSGSGINGNVLTIALAPTGEALSTFYPLSAPTYNYAPLLVWHEAGFNCVAGDAEALPIANGRYRVGQMVLVQAAGGAPASPTLSTGPKQRFKSRFRLTKAKHKLQPPGSAPKVVVFEYLG